MIQLHMLEWQRSEQPCRSFLSDTLRRRLERITARNFGPIMVMAAKTAMATVHDFVERAPETIATPSHSVRRMVRVARLRSDAGGF